MHQPAYTARLPGRDHFEPVSSDDFAAAACDPAACVVVRACAGAGKTWLLVSRLARCLLEGHEPQDLLAITFTRKSAADMQQRLLQLLQSWSALDDKTLRIELRRRGVAETGPEVLQRARGLYPRLLAGGREPTVSTFHGWFAQLLRAAPLRFGLPLQFELLDDETPWLLKAWRRLYAAMRTDPALRADHAALIARLGRSNAQQLVELVWSRRGEFMLAAGAGAIASGLASPEPPSWGEWRDARRAQLQCWLQAWLASGAASAGKLAPDLQAALDGRLDGDDGALGAALRRVFLTTLGEARSARNTATKAVQAAWGAAGGTDDPVLAWDALSQACVTQVEALTAKDIERVHGWALRLGAALLQHYEQLKSENALLDFSDLEWHAGRLLGDSEVSAWVQMRLDRRYRQVLIDEFQDTNPVQWQALQAWLSSYAGDARRPSVFIVGDDKQSIYRFRRADPQVFEAAAEFLREAFGAAQLSAQHTRRLGTAVREWVNAVFDGAPDMRFAAHTGESTLRGHVALLAAAPPDEAEHAQREGAPEPEPAPELRDTLTEPDRDPEVGAVEHDAARIAQLVAQLLTRAEPGQAPPPPSEILVLLRKRKGRMDVYWRALLAAGIPAAAGDGDASLLDTPEAADLLALLGVLVSPAADLDFARVLKSPLVGLEDAALLELARRARAADSSWWHAAQAWAEQDGAPPALGEFLARGARWAQCLQQLPVHDALDRMLAEGEVKARYARAVPVPMRQASAAYLDACMQLALDLEGGRFLTPYAFVRRLRRGLAKAPLPELHAGDVVRLSTIHGAKGLEADVVVLADADSRPAGSGPAVLLHWPAQQAAPSHFSLLLSGRMVHPAQRAWLEAEQRAAAREDWNLLYVAMTRARRQLWVGALPGGGDDTWSARLGAAVPAQELDAALADLPAPAATPRGAPRSGAGEGVDGIAADLAWVPRDAAPALEARAARIGTAMHRLLQAAAPRPDARRWLQGLDARELGASLGLAPGEALAALQAAQRILESAQAREFFDPECVLWARDEVDVLWDPALLAPGRGRIDRLVELHDAVWVLDYKLAGRSLDPAAYAPVLRAYASAAAALRPRKPVRVALLAGDGSVRLWDEAA